MIRVFKPSNAAFKSSKVVLNGSRGESTRRPQRVLRNCRGKANGQQAVRTRTIVTCGAWRPLSTSRHSRRPQSSKRGSKIKAAESITEYVEQNVREESDKVAGSSGLVPGKPRGSGRQLLTQTLKSTLRSNMGGLILVGTILVVVTGVILSQPLLSGQYLQQLVAGADAASSQRLKTILLAMAVAYMLEPICTFLYVTTMSKVAQKFVLELQQKLFATILAQNTAFFDLNSTTSIMGIISSEVNSISDVIGGNLSRDRGFRAIFEATGGVIVLGAIAPRLAPLLLVFIMLTSINAALFSRKTKGLFFQKEMFKVEMDAAASTAFANIKTVRAFAAERYEFSNFLNMLNKSDFLAFKLGRSKASLESLSRFAIYSSLLALYALGGYLVTSGTMPVRTFVASIGYTFSLVFAVSPVIGVFTERYIYIYTRILCI